MMALSMSIEASEIKNRPTRYNALSVEPSKQSTGSLVFVVPPDSIFILYSYSYSCSYPCSYSKPHEPQPSQFPKSIPTTIAIDSIPLSITRSPLSSASSASY
jgi:hypothetical protein